MPFRFLHSKKDKLEKMKSKSKSTTDLLEIRKIMNLDNHLISGHSEAIKTKSKSRLSLFSIHKSSSSQSAKESKKTSEVNSRSSPGTSENKKRGSIVSHLSTETENGHSISLDDSMDSNNNRYDSSHDINALPKQRSSSLCVISQMANRERRLSDIAQLDQYIEYHQRRMADDGSNATRLVCAQLLRQGLFKQLEQMRQGDLLQSHDKPYVSRSMSNVNNNSSSNNNSNNNSEDDNNNNSNTVVHFQKNKNNQKRRWSQWISPVQGQDNRLSLVGQERRRSWMSADSDGEQQQSVCKRDIDNHSFDNQYDCGQERHHVDNLTTRDFLKMPKFLTKRRSNPSITVSQIEIY